MRDKNTKNKLKNFIPFKIPKSFSYFFNKNQDSGNFKSDGDILLLGNAL
jgi:hypothetical protein